MNKIYTAFMIFAVSGLLFASIPVPSNASANLDSVSYTHLRAHET